MRKFLFAALCAVLFSGAAAAAEIDDLVITDASNTARFPENMAPSAVNDGARALEGIMARWYKDTNGSLVSTGSANAYALAINSTDTLYDGQVLCFEANFANTGAATLNVTNSGGAAQGAVSILKHGTEALVTGDILAQQKLCVVYDGSNFQMTTQLAQNIPVNSITGGLIALGSDAQGDIMFYDGTDYARLAAATSGYFLQTQGAGADPVWAANAITGIAFSSNITGTADTGTATIPDDDTIPQITEGKEYMSQAYTPKNANSTLIIDVVGVFANSNQDTFTVALFQDSTANALAAVQGRPAASGEPFPYSFRYTMTAGTTNTITFRVRAGNNSSGTTTFNGAGGSGTMGGVMASSITIMEILP